MFLVVFVTVVISIIALFGQVLTLQASRINAAQVGLMQTMLAWHGAAVEGVKITPPTNMNNLVGCSLTTNVNYCRFVGGVPQPVACNPASTLATYLPPGYQSGGYSFCSVAFQAGNPAVNYVVSYVPLPISNNPGKNMILANGNEIGYSMRDLSRQFNHAAPGNVVYGSVSASGTLTLMAHANGAGVAPPVTSYTIPPAIPVGSIATISVAQ